MSADVGKYSGKWIVGCQSYTDSSDRLMLIGSVLTAICHLIASLCLRAGTLYESKTKIVSYNLSFPTSDFDDD